MEKSLKTVEINRDDVLREALNANESEPIKEIEEEKYDISLTESQLNTIIVSLGLLPMEEIKNEAKEEYNLEPDSLAFNHILYDYMLDLHRSLDPYGDKKEGE
jgi:hypothetical protein